MLYMETAMLTLTSKENSHIKEVIKLQKSARHRRQSGLFVAEGLRVCMDAVQSGAAIAALYISESAAAKNSSEAAQLDSCAEKSFLLSDELFRYISDTQSPQGVLCVIKALDKSAHFGKIKIGGKFLALDNVQDPNNLGTIFRSAEAFGVSGVILSADCCDVYNPKVVRGSMGAVFRLPFLTVDSLETFFLETPGLHTYAAVLDSGAERVTDIRFTEPCAVVIGNEGNGIRQTTVSACQHKITIPMDGKAESLNASVAAAILIWEMVK